MFDILKYCRPTHVFEIVVVYNQHINYFGDAGNCIS